MQTHPHLFERQLTELDFTRLRKLNASHPSGLLADLLENADVVPGPAVDPAVITMYSRFELAEGEAGERRTLAICYPDDAEPSAGFISVLSPLGSSLIGLRAGSTVRWQTPAGVRSARVAAVLFQPEASGDYVT